MAVETIRNGDLLSAQSERAMVRALNTLTNRQAVAATAASVNALHITSAPVAGKVHLQVQVVGTAFASGESMTFGILRLRDGVEATLTATPFTVDDTNGTAAAVLDGSGSVDTDASIEKGDILHIVRTYTAGGGPTATITTATIQVE